MVAHVLGENNQLDEAIALWKSLLVVKPNDEFALKSLSYAYFARKDFGQAVALAKRYVETAGETVAKGSKIYLLIAEALWAQDEKAESRQWANRFLENK